MATMSCRELLLVCVFLAFGIFARAENFTTNIINGTSLDTGDDYIVGDSGLLNYFEINSGGAQTNLDGIIGSQSTANRNTAVITDPNSLWFNEGDLYVGSTGSVSQLTIKNGAHAINARGLVGSDVASLSNKVVVTGTNSLWSNTQTLSVGADGSFNQLIITNGGRVDNTFASVGLNADAISNSVTVTGTNSLWNSTGVLRVGDSGPGSRLTIDNGGRVNNTDGQIGRLSTSTNNIVLITGTNSFWSNSGSLIVGISGGGNSVTIQDGGMVSNIVGHLGFNSSGGTNTVLVTGTNTVWFNRDKVVVGNNGGGNQLTISNSAWVRATNVVVGAGSAGNRLDVTGGYLLVSNSSSKATLSILGGTMTLNAGTVTVDQLVVTNITLGPVIRTNAFVHKGGVLNTRASVVTNGLPFVVGDGTNSATLNPLSGTHTFANGLTISSNAYLTGTGTISASTTNAGTISPGSSAGKLTISGNLTLQPSSVLNLELGGYVQGSQYDVIAVSNAAAFAGKLIVNVINGFQTTVTNGASFTVLTASSISGAFGNAASGARLITADGFGDVLVTYSGANLVLSDYRDNRDNDGDSIPNWWEQLYFGSPTAADPNADTDGDGMSNLQEFLAGTSPLSAASALRITSIAADASHHTTLVWQSIGGRRYRVQYSDGDGAGGYNGVFTDIVRSAAVEIDPAAVGASSSMSFTDDFTLTGGAPPHGMRYFRIKVVQ
jgi:T5SS/PEP-CTERM-associated repeat protein